jgi:hypothetical protein
METSLHHALKERYAAGHDHRREVVVEGFRVDAVDGAGRLVEIQSGPLGPLRLKLLRLLPERRLRIVKPVVLRRRLVRRLKHDGPVVSIRYSPKQGALCDVFDDLIGVVRVFPHTNLEIEVLGVTIDEVRVPRRRWPFFKVIDRCLGEIQGSTTLKRAGDLWALLPGSCGGNEPFTTFELAQRLDRPLWLAQRIAYCLRLTGAAQVVGKTGNRLIYRRKVNDLADPLDPTDRSDLRGRFPRDFPGSATTRDPRRRRRG